MLRGAGGPVEVAQLVLHHMAVDRDMGRRTQARKVQRLRMRLDRAEIGRHPVAHLLRRLGDLAEAMHVGQRRACHAAIRQRALGGAELDRRRVRAAGIDEGRRTPRQAASSARSRQRPAGGARGSRVEAPGHVATDVGLQSFSPNRIASFPLHPLTHSTSKTRAAQSLPFFRKTPSARLRCSPRRYLLTVDDRRSNRFMRVLDALPHRVAPRCHAQRP